MPKEINNNHTVLVKVIESTQDSGQGIIVAGHPEVSLQHGVDVRSGWLRGRIVGGHYVMNVQISIVSRRFVGIAKLNMPPEEFVKTKESVAFFIDSQRNKLVQEFEDQRNNPVEKVSNVDLQNWDDMIVGLTPASSNTTQGGEPIAKSNIYISDSDRAVLETVRRIAGEKPAKVMMVGASGYGKSSIPQQMASEWDMQFVRIDCATITDQEEFFGYRGIKGGDTMQEDGTPIFNPSPFTKAVTEGNCVVVLDELNRIDPYIQNVLFPMLDHAAQTTIANHTIKVGPNVVFFATVNVGYKFTGTFQIDAALTNRFTVSIKVGALPELIETALLQAREGLSRELARHVVKFMQLVRDMNEHNKIEIDASTRMSLQLASLIANGLDPKTSVYYCICNKVDEKSSKQILDSFGSIFGG